MQKKQTKYTCHITLCISCQGMKVLTHGKERIIGFPVLPTVQMEEGVEKKSDLDSIIEKEKKHRESIPVETFFLPKTSDPPIKNLALFSLSKGNISTHVVTLLSSSH
jgi:hypothetical protein